LLLALPAEVKANTIQLHTIQNEGHPNPCKGTGDVWNYATSQAEDAERLGDGTTKICHEPGSAVLPPGCVRKPNGKPDCSAFQWKAPEGAIRKKQQPYHPQTLQRVLGVYNYTCYHS